jgi:hypothetical protein
MSHVGSWKGEMLGSNQSHGAEISRQHRQGQDEGREGQVITPFHDFTSPNVPKLSRGDGEAGDVGCSAMLGGSLTEQPTERAPGSTHRSPEY